MDNKIITLPLKAYKNDKIGLLVIPIFAELLKMKTGFETTLALNLSDSFEDKTVYIENYYNLIKTMNIKLDNVWTDRKNSEKLLNEINVLVKLGLIKEKRKNIRTCKCHKVEIEKEIAEKLEGKCYRRENSKLICNYCNEELTLINEPCLVFEAPENTAQNVMTIPKRIGKQMRELDKKIGGQDIIISRKRETGYPFQYNEKCYNIDIDFIWQNYLSTITTEEKKIIIGSNHTIYAMYMINLMEMCKKRDNLLFIVLPHVKGLENIDFKNLNEVSRKIVLALAASKMKEPNSKWDSELYKYIEKGTEAKKNLYFKLLYEKNPMQEGEKLENYIDRIIIEDISFQKIVQKSKRIEERER